MSDPFTRPFPRGALLGAGALLGLSLLLVTGSRINGVGATRMPEAAIVSTLDLRFADREDGAVVATAASDGRIVAIYDPGTNGFVRGVMRGLARDRRRDGIGAEPPFRLTRWTDGRMSLTDLATGVNINLEVFGPTNAAAFAQLFGASELPATAGTGT
jgi:putative photosynthetic complex assembly protein